MKKYVLLGLAVVVLLGGAFANMIQGQKDAVQQAVRNYDRQLTLSLEKRDKSLMAQTATDVEALRIELIYSNLADSGKVMGSKLISLDIKSVAIGSKPFADGPSELQKDYQDKTNTAKQAKILAYARASAQEKWLFQYFSLENSSPMGQQEEANYKSIYFLVKDSTGWKVAGVQT